MARDEQDDGIASEGATDRAGGPGRADPAGDLAVARDLAPADVANRSQDPLVEGRAIGKIHGQARRWCVLAGEERLDDRGRFGQELGGAASGAASGACLDHVECPEPP